MSISFDMLGIWFKLLSRWFYTRDARNRLASLATSLKPGDNVLDLGGGTGTLTEILHKRRPDLTFTCLDPAMGMLRYTPSYANRILGRAERLPLKRVFAAIMIGDAMHHFEDPERAVEELHDVLKMDGKIFIFDINPNKLAGRGIAFLEKLLGEPARFYGPDVLGDLLIRKGFKVLSITRYFRYTVEAI